MQKITSDLRKKLISQRKKLAPEQRAEAFRRISNTFFDLLEYKSSQSITAYFGKIESGEFDTRELLQQILNDGKKLFLPRCREGEIALDVYEINDIITDVEEGAYGIMEPKKSCKKQGEEISDIIIVPGSVFDYRGARYGYGAGFYDNYLAGRKILKVAFALDMAVMKEPIPTHPRDIFMDIIITEKNIYRNKSNL